ncbi:flagellar hook-basal body complex protein FliE [Stomatohabitans albus]|uniref:flagellar hook-basal body complex protein FliE n=1 Tax=Stomatohabitans albus TaxID=3110766 RepID=UPI00300D9000
MPSSIPNIGMTTTPGVTPLTNLVSGASQPTIGRFNHGIQGFDAFAKPTAAGAVDAPAASRFQTALTGAINQLSETHATADALAEQAATGTLTDIHDYMVASTQAQISTEFAVNLRNRALESFNEIMRMQV